VLRVTPVCFLLLLRNDHAEITFRLKDSWRVLSERPTREGGRLVSGLVGVRCGGRDLFSKRVTENRPICLTQSQEDRRG
jgi:hypothetical protein